MARRFKQARKLRGLTAIAAAKEMNVSTPTVNAWEAGRKTPSIEGLEKMADLYQVTTDYLLGRPEPFSSNPSTELSPDLIKIFDGRPAWSDRLGWVLVNGPDCIVITNDGTKVTLVSYKHSSYKNTPGTTYPPTRGIIVLFMLINNTYHDIISHHSAETLF